MGHRMVGGRADRGIAPIRAGIDVSLTPVFVPLNDASFIRLPSCRMPPCIQEPLRGRVAAFSGGCRFGGRTGCCNGVRRLTRQHAVLRRSCSGGALQSRYSLNNAFRLLGKNAIALRSASGVVIGNTFFVSGPTRADDEETDLPAGRRQTTNFGELVSNRYIEKSESKRRIDCSRRLVIRPHDVSYSNVARFATFS